VAKTYLLDTSVVIDSVDNLKILSDEGENLIVITEVVLSESDHLKGNPGSVGYMARRFNNFLQDAQVVETQRLENHTITKLLHQGVRIELVSQKKYEEGFANNNQILIVFVSPRSSLNNPPVIHHALIVVGKPLFILLLTHQFDPNTLME